jgi:hypothetical protein
MCGIWVLAPKGETVMYFLVLLKTIERQQGCSKALRGKRDVMRSNNTMQGKWLFGFELI